MKILVRNVATSKLPLSLDYKVSSSDAIRERLVWDQVIDIGRRIEPYELNRTTYWRDLVTASLITVTFAADGDDLVPPPSGSSASGYDQLQNAGVDITQRTKANFAGGLQAVDNGIDFRSDISVVFGTAAGTAAVGNDTRIPTQSENDALAGTSGAPSNTNRYVTDADARNANARTPTVHASSHEPGGGDAMAVDAAAGVGSLRTVGTGALQACAGNDGRLSDARTPTAHAASHLPAAADPLSTAAPGTIAIGDAAATGVANAFARSDHVHALPVPAAPVDVTKAAASAGVATTAARADHKHDVSTAVPGATVDAGAAAAEGSATSLARSDHQHAVSTAAAGDLAAADAAAASAGTGTNIPRADHKHQVTTAAPSVTIKSEATAAGAGTASSLVRSDAQWQVATAAPSVTVKSEATAASQGSASTVLRSDAQIQVATAAPSTIGTANAQGSSSSVARADHVHDHGAQTNGTLHAAATTSTAGFESAADKTVVDSVNGFTTSAEHATPVTTTDATATNIGSVITIPAGKVVTIEIEFIGRLTTHDGSLVEYIRRWIYENTSGTITLRFNTAVADNESTTPTDLTAATIPAPTISGADVQPRVQGKAATNMTWSAFRRVRISD